MGRDDFITYVLDFYNGETGIYKDIDATPVEVSAATCRLEAKYGSEVCYDSLDRERVRDIILGWR